MMNEKGNQLMKNPNIRFSTILVLASLLLSLKAHAVSPAPDGGYTGGNTAEGQNALLSLTGGLYNTGIGIFSLLSLTDGRFCTGVGAGTLLANTADENTATGAGALLSNTTGDENTANGAFALFSNTEGNFNTATGVSALNDNTTGSSNTADGFQALLSNTTGSANTANGFGALFSNTTGGGNTASGVNALLLNTTGSANTAYGSGAGANVATASHVICIGDEVGGENVDNSCYIGSIFGQTSSGGTAVFINSDGRLGTATSSQRFKDAIRPMENGSEALLALKPVTFRYKKEIDPQCIPQFGLVAEEVEAVNPDLVIRDKEGNPYTVRYDAVNAMLLNQSPKQHQKVPQIHET